MSQEKPRKLKAAQKPHPIAKEKAKPDQSVKGKLPHFDRERQTEGEKRELTVPLLAGEVKSQLSTHLISLDRIWDDFIRNSELRVTELRLEKWKQEMEELLSPLGKKENLRALSRLVTETITDPVERFFEQVKRYRSFLSSLIKEWGGYSSLLILFLA